jgi:protein TonB
MWMEHVREPFLGRMRKPEGIAPNVHRSSVIRLGMRPRVLFEFSLATALGLVIAGFVWFPDIEPKAKILQASQEVVTIEDVDLTQQIARPPAPSRPPIPIETTADVPMDDVEIFSSEIDIAAEMPPPPPKQDGYDSDADYFVVVEEFPQLVGGLEGLLKRLTYPPLALRAGVQGTVFVMAFVNESGNVVKAEVQKGIGAGCDEAALAAVMESKFIPGKQRGKPVKVRMVIPIHFRIRTL